MPNTSKGFPYPTSSDDPNVPSDIQALAQAVDTSLNNYSQTSHAHTGVYAPTTHSHTGEYADPLHTHTQYLEQDDLAGYSQTTHNHDSTYSSTTHNHSGVYAPTTHSHTEYLSTSAINGTKGAIPVGTATGVSTITPGANDYVLVADDTTATGTKWANIAAVGTVVPNTFSNISVAGQTTVSADTTVDTLTLVAGDNILITTNATTDTITIAASGGSVEQHENALDPHPQYLTSTEANALYDPAGSASAAQTAAASYTDTAISNLVGGAPTALNTLHELATALNNDAIFATTVTNQISSIGTSANTYTDTKISDHLSALDPHTQYYNQSRGDARYARSAFSTIAVTGQTSIESDAIADTLTISAGTGITITTDATTDSIIISSSGSASLPSQTGNAGKYLTTNGSTASWGTIDLSPYVTTTSLSSTLGSYVTSTSLTATLGSYASKEYSDERYRLLTDVTVTDPILNGTITTGFATAGFVKTNASGILSSSAQISNSDIADGTIQNAKLANSTITINGSAVSLGGTATISGLPSQTGYSGRYLTTDGTNASWAVVDALPSQTGNSGRYLTTNGSTSSWSVISQVPSVSGNAGKYLYSDGSNYSWQSVSTAAYSNGTNTGNANKIFYNNTGSIPAGTAAGDIYIQY